MKVLNFQVIDFLVGSFCLFNPCNLKKTLQCARLPSPVVHFKLCVHSVSVSGNLTALKKKSR